MADQTLKTPEDFPNMEDVVKGDTRKFLVEVKCTDKEKDGMEWEVLSIDGVKLQDKDEDEDAFDGYDSSADEDTDEDVDSEGKAKTTRGVGMMILGGKP